MAARLGGASAALVVVSTSRAAGEEVDHGIPALREFADRLGMSVTEERIVTDDLEQLAGVLRELADRAEDAPRLILTSGGTGFSPDDVTPEATEEVIERRAPGIAEAMRLASRAHTGHWLLSRAVAGVRGSTLIVNFPGNPKAIAEAGEPLLDALPHALALLGGDRGDPHTGGAGAAGGG